jgi:hypothetical protein
MSNEAGAPIIGGARSIWFLVNVELAEPTADFSAKDVAAVLTSLMGYWPGFASVRVTPAPEVRSITLRHNDG